MVGEFTVGGKRYKFIEGKTIDIKLSKKRGSDKTDKQTDDKGCVKCGNTEKSHEEFMCFRPDGKECRKFIPIERLNQSKVESMTSDNPKGCANCTVYEFPECLDKKFIEVIDVMKMLGSDKLKGDGK